MLEQEPIAPEFKVLDIITFKLQVNPYLILVLLSFVKHNQDDKSICYVERGRLLLSRVTEIDLDQVDGKLAQLCLINDGLKARSSKTVLISHGLDSLNHIDALTIRFNRRHDFIQETIDSL